MREQFKQGFSLMEMMVVLLIIAIIAAATAPMVSKKMARNAGSGDSPWVFTGLNNSIAYNMNGSNASALIGTSRYNRGDNGPQYPRLVLASGDDGHHPAFAFADANGNFSGQMNMNQTSGIVTLNNAAVGNNSTAIGMGQTIEDSPSGIVAIGQGLSVASGSDDAIAIGKGVAVNGINAIAIGNNDSNTTSDTTQATAKNTIAIGQSAQATGAASGEAIAIGYKAKALHYGTIAIGFEFESNNPGLEASGTHSIAIGGDTKALDTETVAVGYRATADAPSSIAIGNFAEATGVSSVAIGNDAKATTDSTIVLGNPDYRNNSTLRAKVYIPGDLVVDGNVVLARNTTSKVYMRAERSTGNNDMRFGQVRHSDGGHLDITGNRNNESFTNIISVASGCRLKNVGEKYTAGLSELKQLDFFHFIYKKDAEKTPHVGVMAQDLQKVFPDAVTKDEDGYLRIRFEDMFYAVINAVKELDNKITEIVNNIMQINSVDEKQNQTIAEQQKTIEQLKNDNAEQQKMIDEQQKLIKNLEKRIEKLEG